MKTFRSFPLKLAVIDALMEKNLLKKEMTAFRKAFPEEKVRQYYEENPGKNHEPHPGVSKYFSDLDLPAELLARVEDISFEGGNEIYRIVTPDWDGEDDQFTVRDFSDLEHLPNLRSLVDTVLVDVDDARVLLKLSKLSSVDVEYGSSIRDAETIAALEKAGIRIENKTAEERAASEGPDPELRLALDYGRAQELLWDEDEPKAALALLEKILVDHPGDADTWFEKGNALDALEKLDAAATAWGRCLELKEKYPEANYALANYYKDRGDFPQAQAQIDAAIANGLKFSPEAWHIRGQLQLHLGIPKTAHDNLKKALELYHHNLKAEDDRAECLYQIACVSALLKEDRTAEDYLRQAIELDASYRNRAKNDSDLAGFIRHRAPEIGEKNE